MASGVGQQPAAGLSRLAVASTAAAAALLAAGGFLVGWATRDLAEHQRRRRRSPRPQPRQRPRQPLADGALPTGGVPLPKWLQWLAGDEKHYRFTMREWEDLDWREARGWKGSDLIHAEGSAVRIPCYFYSPEEKALRGPVVFGVAAESHRGLCHGGSMTSVIDDVVGHLCFLGAGRGPWDGATVQVNCKLSKPVTVGQTLKVEGKITRQEKKKVFIEASLSDEHGTLYASAEGISIVEAKMQAERSALDSRRWVFDEANRVVSDFAAEDREQLSGLHRQVSSALARLRAAR